MAAMHRVGGLDVLAVSDGLLRTSLDLLLDFPREAAIALTGAEPDGSLSIPVNSYVFRRPGAVVLVDTGAGDTMQPTLGRLPGALAAAGVPPAEVTHILLTHLHPDHANGLIGPDGAAVYPQAELVIAAEELDFWLREGAPEEGDAVRRMRARNRVNLEPYRERTRRMREGEVVLGCTPIVAAGHSPGHTCWLIETGGLPMLAWGDIAHLAAVQVPHPEAALTYDFDKEVAKRSRRRILDLAADEGMVVAGAHIGVPGLGRITRDGGTYAFTPA